jgi:hypothetical protein
MGAMHSAGYAYHFETPGGNCFHIHSFYLFCCHVVLIGDFLSIKTSILCLFRSIRIVPLS